VAIDLQVATVGLATQPVPAQGVIKRTAELAAAFRDAGLPVIWVTVAGGASGRTDLEASRDEVLPDNWTDLVDELGARPSDQRFVKYAWGAFHDGRMDELLGDLSVHQIVLTGIATSIGVESTARAAYERNFNVAVVTDAVGDPSLEAHWNSVRRI